MTSEFLYKIDPWSRIDIGKRNERFDEKLQDGGQRKNLGSNETDEYLDKSFRNSVSK